MCWNIQTEHAQKREGSRIVIEKIVKITQPKKRLSTLLNEDFMSAKLEGFTAAGDCNSSHIPTQEYSSSSVFIFAEYVEVVKQCEFL